MSMADEPQVTPIPDGVEPANPGDWQAEVPCDILIRFDDGTDDTPNSGPTLGGPSAPYQYLGVVFPVPADQDYKVQSASWFSDFWVWAGNVNVEVAEVGNPANSTSGVVNVTDGGTWEIEFADPICVPAGSDVSVMLCPEVGVWGVVGQDLSAPDSQSWWTNTDLSGCEPINNTTGDYMIWFCVTPCGATPIENTSWGAVKSLYR
jgi:hypothetical protein